jgi:hypothetical protein
VSVQVKGSAITARIRWVRELYGEQGFRALKHAVPEASRKHLEGRILPHEWVPFELLIDVSVELDRLYGKGDLELCRELGRYAARVNLPTLYRIFYALGSPHFILKRAARVWDVHYSSGRMTAEAFTEPGDVEGARIQIVAFATPHRAHCLSVTGWAEQSITLSGGKVVETGESKCRLRGDEVCEIFARWT